MKMIDVAISKYLKEIGARGNESQKKKHGKKYGDEMRRRVSLRKDRKKLSTTDI